MATQFLNVTLDGINPADRLPGGGSVPWYMSGSRATIDRYSVYVELPDDLDATVNLTGTNWRIRTFQVAADEGITRIVDLDNGAEREIEFMNIGYDSVVNLMSTRVRYMNGWDGELHDITLGSDVPWVHWINLGAAVNKIDTSAGWVGGVDMYNGRGEVTVRGGAGTIDMGGQDDKLTVDGGRVISALMQNGNDTTIVQNGGRIEYLNDFGGNASITIGDGSRIESFRGGNGDVSMTVNGTGRVETVAVFFSNFTFRSEDGWTRTITGHDVSSDIVIGAGGGSSIKFTSDTAQTHKIVTNAAIDLIDLSDSASNAEDDQSSNLWIKSWADALILGNGDDVVRTGDKFVGTINSAGGSDTIRLGDGGAETVVTGDGNDRVVTSTGWVGNIRTGNGDDTVVHGGGGGSLVSLGDGDDKILVSEMDPNYGLTIHGWLGTDTIDFRNFTVGVTFTLASPGTLQDVAGNTTPADSVDSPSVKGYFAQTGMDNIYGTSKVDVLTGNKLANLLLGQGGNDRLFGLAGNDTLNGGFGNDRLVGGLGRDKLIGGKGNDVLQGDAGNDILRGQAGKDVFVFGANSGTDTVKDYTDGIDTLRIADHTGGFASLAISVANGDKIIEHDGGTIILDGKGGVTLTASDFDFV
ncbi:calcium-binding protein [Seohaeicola zhoushanensis]|uniref:Calcium-binding protein n=1 Tax=Seohaeicola zhoushanensis TaxID=1569283 RepID=A0A8J3H301_9RHOB|nr:calcium-binding protein [Seohaeicola zhoushanensis]GHF69878.1 hypothetical protein GCM10017056_46150 [Seohaeicola zhoushanensis]